MALKGKHLFKMTKILNKLGDLPKLEKGISTEEVGISILRYVIGNLDKAENEIYELVGEYLDTPARSVKEMEFNKFVNAIKEIISEVNFKDFLSLRSK